MKKTIKGLGVTPDYSKGTYFQNTPKMGLDVSKFISDVHDYAWCILERHGGERTPLSDYPQVDALFVNDNSQEHHIPADAYFSIRILKHLYWANHWYNKGIAEPNRHTTDYICINIVLIVETLHTPLKTKKASIGKSEGGKKGTVLLTPIVKIIEGILTKKEGHKLTSNEIWNAIVNKGYITEGDYSVYIDADFITVYNTDTERMQERKKSSFPRYVKKAKDNIKKLQ